MKYFTSDTHWYHSNLLAYCPERAERWGNNDVKEVVREYVKSQDRDKFREALKDIKHSWKESTERMTEGLIANWNAKVSKSDEVYHLGDLAMGNWKKHLPILDRLNGKKYLIRGNHDYYTKKPEFAQKFEWIKDYYALRVSDEEAPRGKQLIIMCHFPLLVWDEGHHGSFCLNGHSHGSIDKINQETTRLDVGVDAEFSNYEPLSYEEIKGIMNKKSYKIIDHHNLDKSL